MLAKDQQDPAKRLSSIEQNLINLLESTSDAFVSIDREWRYTYMNRNAERIERIKREDIIGKKMWEVFPNVRQLPFFKIYEQVMETREPATFEEFIDNKWNEARVFPFDGGLTVYYRDITDRKEQEERKDEFTRMTSHELQTPITSLRLYFDLLSKTLATTEAKHYAGKMSEQVNKLERLVGDLLDMSRIQADKMPLLLSKFNIVELVADVTSTLKLSLKDHQLVVNLPTTPILIKGDRDRLTQVLNNVIQNAAKYSPARTEIQVTMEQTPTQARIAIKDFGIGIDPAFHEDIFQSFYQLDERQGYTFPGLGVGLYVAKLIVDRHGGKIEVNSEIGRGSVFTLCLPLANDSE